MEYPNHDAEVLAAIARIRGERERLVQLGMQVVPAGGGLRSMDFLVIGTIKRHMSAAAGFTNMLETWNMLCARVLLRTHIDTALRFSAAWLVKDPQAFADAVFHGEQVNHLKDCDGKRLSDAHLVDARSADYPWLPDVYRNLSGYVHFSNSHIFAPVVHVQEDEGTVQFAVTETDTNFPAWTWLESANCFSDTTAILCDYIESYATSLEQFAGT